MLHTPLQIGAALGAVLLPPAVTSALFYLTQKRGTLTHVLCVISGAMLALLAGAFMAATAEGVPHGFGSGPVSMTEAVVGAATIAVVLAVLTITVAKRRKREREQAALPETFR